jgi:flagella basal body P-ring formation protein FlgA
MLPGTFIVVGLAAVASGAPQPVARAPAASAPSATVVVPGAALRDAAIAEVRALGTAAGIALDFSGTDVPRDLRLAAPLQSVDANPPAVWLRARIPVTVRAQDIAGRVTTTTVWLRMTAMSPGRVYSRDLPAGSRAATADVTEGRVDLARSHGASAASEGVIVDGRLRRAVRAGQPALAGDFEPMPAVLARQAVRIEGGRGRLRLRLRGIALSDGGIGDWIDVRWSGGERPMRARVTSHEVVTLEN